MDNWTVAGIVILVFAVIISNLMLLKNSAKMKVPKSVIDAVKAREKALQDKKQQQHQDEQKKQTKK